MPMGSLCLSLSLPHISTSNDNDDKCVCVCCTEVENLKRHSLKTRIHAHIHLLNQESERYYQFCVECVY